jgi:phospholipid-binding lipoprotein MlaA
MLRAPSGLLLAVLLLSGCASTAQRTAGKPVGDPFERINRAVYKFNDKADRWVLRPAAVGWRKTIPTPLRTGLVNVLDNLSYPITTVNSLLQGKVKQSGGDLARFVMNSTVGFLGIFDPATEVGLVAHDEDFGQTLNTWGVPQGPYLMVPLFGPYTLTHGFGTLATAPLSPYISFQDPAAGLALYALYSVDRRGALLEADREVYEAFDPYAFVRDAYLQNRAYKIADGNLAEPDYDAELEESGDDMTVDPLDPVSPPAGDSDGEDPPAP